MAVGLVVLGGTMAAGCFDSFDDCYESATCPPPGEGGTGGGGNPVCAADPTQDPAAVVEDCGVFVSASAAPGGDGTRARPFASLQEGINAANGRRVYACTDGAFAEKVTIGSGIEVIGGFDCAAGWTWSPEARSTIEGPVDQVALTITEAASGAKVQSFAVNAPSATMEGGSSIAVAVADVEAALVQVDVTAGDGMAGANGQTPMEAPTPGAPAVTGMDIGAPTPACVLPNGVTGGQPGVTMCDDGETRGGIGGLGGVTGTDAGNGQGGQNGEPLPDPNPDGYGLGGDGQTDPDGTCSGGEDGLPGASGGPGAASTATLLSLDGISGGDGAPGITGARGQGGGGGGGAKSGVFCMNPAIDGPGASGGGGGGGGCGGKGGGGGQAGGSSIGIVSLGTRLVLTEVTGTVGMAGNGGSGAVGQSGAAGGGGAAGGAASGINPSKSGCQGGAGGQGGGGGPGAGGRGGHAVGIAYAATPPTPPALSSFIEGAPGDGGVGGPGGSPGSDGAPGSAAGCWDFAANASCGG
jgi:hypothetical protein